MTSRGLRTLVAGAISAVLLIVAVGTAGSVSAAIPDRSFQVLGCGVGDYTCFYAKLGGGSSNSYYCQTGYYTCRNGVPDNTPSYNQNVSPYCGDGGATGCLGGSALYPVTAANSSYVNAGGNTPNIVVAGNFVDTGTAYLPPKP